MRRICNCVQDWAESITIRDIGLFKVCLISFGMLLGTSVRQERKQGVHRIAGGIFLVSLISLAARFLLPLRCEAEEKGA